MPVTFTRVPLMVDVCFPRALYYRSFGNTNHVYKWSMHCGELRGTRWISLTWVSGQGDRYVGSTGQFRRPGGRPKK